MKILILMTDTIGWFNEGNTDNVDCVLPDFYLERLINTTIYEGN